MYNMYDTLRANQYGKKYNCTVDCSSVATATVSVEEMLIYVVSGELRGAEWLINYVDGF
jgi:hypothetical protein